jgi:hypothetical protein
MGDMLIDGYWSNTDYAPGQEELLYKEASEVIAQLSKPTVTYSASIQNLSCIGGYELEDGLLLAFTEKRTREEVDELVYCMKSYQFDGAGKGLTVDENADAE